MKQDAETSGNFLSEGTEEEFGRGAEISTTAFLIFGLLTFWIYTVWSYHRLVQDHLTSRLRHFSRTLNPSQLPAETRTLFETLVEKGFSYSQSPKYICTLLYFCSMALLVGLLAHKSLTGNLAYKFDFVVVGLAALLFCGSTIFFLTWVCRTMRSHEYHELLLLKMSQNPDDFRWVQPSSIFTKRWNRNQSWIALFLVISIPMTLSPAVGVEHFYASLASHPGWPDVIAIGWVAGLLLFAGIFHLWGSHLLINMYNGHLRIEDLNRQHGTARSQWISERSTSVLSEPGIDEMGAVTEKLLPERALAAIMITDMVGFSKEMELDEERGYTKLLKHNQIIRRNIAKNNGEELKTMGDAFLVRFKSAVQAVKAALSIQSDFSDYNTGKEVGDVIMVRIGIHIGDVLIMGGDILGNGVNVAARIEPLAEPGGICISADVYNIVRRSIDIKAFSLGKKELKNIREVPEIYKIVLESVRSQLRERNGDL